MGAKSDVAVKLVLVFFISLLSFSIGTYIGKKYSDNQHKLAQLEPGAASEAKRSVASEGHEALISDDEIKNLADDKTKDVKAIKDEFIADDTQGSAPQAATHDTHQASPQTASAAPHSEVKKTEHAPAAVTPATKHDEDAPLEAAKEFLNGKVPEAKVAPKVENRLPSSLPKDISQYALGKFTVQVASYNTKEEAEKRAHKLKEQGYQTNIFSAKVEDKTWYRVSFGLYGTNEEAQTERAKYLEKFKTESALVQKIKN